MTYRKVIALDFDGVLHRYSRGWENGDCYDVPTFGCREALEQLAMVGRLVICTARDTPDKVWDWLEKHGLDDLIEEVSNTKPGAFVYIDDRAVHFGGEWDPVLAEVHRRLETDGWKPVA